MKKKNPVTCFSNERILYQDVSTLNDSDHTYQDWWLEMETKWLRIPPRLKNSLYIQGVPKKDVLIEQNHNQN